MPCNSNYMEPTQAERNKVAVCKHLVYAANKYMIGIPFDSEITKGADSCYGAEALTLDFLVKTLCDLLGRVDQEMIYTDRSTYGLRLALYALPDSLWFRSQDPPGPYQNPAAPERLLSGLHRP